MAVYRLSKLNRVFLKFSHETSKLRPGKNWKFLPLVLQRTEKVSLLAIIIINPYWPSLFLQDGWIWASYNFAFLLTLTSSRFHKNLKKNYVYPAILTSRLPWSVMHMWPIGLASSCMLARGFNLILPDKSERFVLALKMGPFWWVKYSPFFVSNLALINKGQ